MYFRSSPFVHIIDLFQCGINDIDDVTTVEPVLNGQLPKS